LLAQEAPLKELQLIEKQADAGTLFMLRCDRHGHVQLFYDNYGAHGQPLP